MKTQGKSQDTLTFGYSPNIQKSWSYRHPSVEKANKKMSFWLRRRILCSWVKFSASHMASSDLEVTHPLCQKRGNAADGPRGPLLAEPSGLLNILVVVVGYCRVFSCRISTDKVDVFLWHICGWNFTPRSGKGVEGRGMPPETHQGGRSGWLMSIQRRQWPRFPGRCGWVKLKGMWQDKGHQGQIFAR